MKVTYRIKQLAGFILTIFNSSHGSSFTSESHQQELPLPLAVLAILIAVALIGILAVIAIAYLTR